MRNFGKRLHMLPHWPVDADTSVSTDDTTSLQHQQYSIAYQQQAWVCVIVAVRLYPYFEVLVDRVNALVLTMSADI